jgi:hypothetical protein
MFQENVESSVLNTKCCIITSSTVKKGPLEQTLNITVLSLRQRGTKKAFVLGKATEVTVRDLKEIALHWDRIREVYLTGSGILHC